MPYSNGRESSEAILVVPQKKWHPRSGGGCTSAAKKSLAAKATPVEIVGLKENHGVTPRTDVGHVRIAGAVSLTCLRNQTKPQLGGISSLIPNL